MFEMGIGTLIIYTGIVAYVAIDIAANYKKGDFKRLCHEARISVKHWFADDFFGTK